MKIRFKHDKLGRGAKNSLRALARRIPDKELVFLCIGTPLISGDRVGPIVGHYLAESEIGHVYGTIKSPVDALNIHEVGELINAGHEDAFIFAIDSIMGIREESVGVVEFRRSPMKPGSGLDKNLGEYGDLSIGPIVCCVGEDSSPYDRHLKLKEVKDEYVMDLARSVFESILYILWYREYKFGIMPTMSNGLGGKQTATTKMEVGQ